MKDITNILIKYKVLLIFVLLIFFVIPNNCYAGVIDKAVTGMIGGIAQLIILVCGWILSIVIKAILTITQYNNFIHEEPIRNAWIIIRDLCNMFFVLVLLIIAFATILRIENYSMKKWLPKLVIMAVLINFSRMICGLLIDFSQVIMLTFVNAFGENGSNFITMLRVDEYLKIAQGSASWSDSETQLNLTNTVGAMVVAILFLIIATIAMSAILVVFIMRVVMLWIYIVLSPLAFLLSSFPGGQKYASNYWGDLTKYLLNGPVLAFFIWLSLMVMAGAGEFSNKSFVDMSNNTFTPGTGAVVSILQDKSFMSFVMAIGMLVGGLMISSKIGGIGASWGAGKVKSLADKGMVYGKKAGGLAWRKSVDVTKGVAKEGWAQSQKTKLGRDFKGVTQRFKSAGGAGTGAVIGTALLPGIGTVVGAGIGALLGKYSVDKITKRRKRNQRRYQAARDGDKGAFLNAEGNQVSDMRNAEYIWSDDKGSYTNKHNGQRYVDKDGKIISRFGEYEDSKENKYRRVSEKSNEMRRVNSKGEFITVAKDGTEKVVNDYREADKANTKAMTKEQAERWGGYSTAKYKGWGIKDSMIDEKVNKLAGEYQSQSKESMQHFLDLETDENKKMAISLSMAMKKGFADGVKGIKQVMKAKEFLSGNSLLQKRVNDEMNKRHMIMNNARIEKKAGGIEKVVLDEGAIAKLVSKGDAKWKDQNWKTHNEESVKLMSKQLGVGFSKEFSASLKTNKDKDQAIKTIGKFVKDLNFDDRDNRIRKSFAATSGDFIKAFQDNSGRVKGEELGKMISKISKASDFADVDKISRIHPVFKEQFARNINIGMVNKMNNSPDISSALMKEYVKMIKENNTKLFNQMEKDNKLRPLTKNI